MKQRVERWGSFLFPVCSVNILAAIGVVKANYIMVLFAGSSLCSIFVKKTRHCSCIALSTLPVVTLQSVLHCLLSLLLLLLLISYINCCLSHEELVLSQDQLFVVTAKFRFWQRKFCTFEIDSPPWIIEIGDVSLIINIDWYFTKHMWSTFETVLSLYI